MESADGSGLFWRCGRGLDDCADGERVVSAAEADSSASLLRARQDQRVQQVRGVLQQFMGFGAGEAGDWLGGGDLGGRGGVESGGLGPNGDCGGCVGSGQ